MKNFSFHSKPVLVQAASASAGTAVNTASVDMYGFDSVCFFGSMATIAGNAVNLAISEDDATFVDLAETTLNPTANGDVWMIDIHRPLGGRYIRAEVGRSGTNTALGQIYAVLYNARDVPVEHESNISALFVNAPKAA